MSATVTEWSADDVRMDDVLAGLGELAAAAAEDPELRRASVLNLVAIAHDEDERAELEAVIDGLTGAHPSRAVVVTTVGSGDRGHVDATCRLEAGSAGAVCVERIGLTVHGGAAAGASAVMPLLRTSLPTFLWWPGAPAPEHAGWQRLAGVAVRVICETDRGRATGDAAGALAAVLDADGPAISDLAWTALTPWRRLVAQLVDEAAWARLQAGPSRLSLTGGGLEADLMAGWLAWLLGPALAIERIATDPGLSRVALSGPLGGHLHIECLGEGDVAEIAADWPGSVARRRALPLPRRGRAGLLADELALQGRDPVFEAAVRTAAAT